MRHIERIIAPLAGVVLATLATAALATPATKTESFDRDPGWDHANNRPADRNDQPVTIRQDFGFSTTSRAGGTRAGEIGGFVTAAAEPAWYGRVIAVRTLNEPLTASGTFSVADGGTNLLVGFFNADTAREWRTPNTLCLRINGRGDHFFAYLEYCTSAWRAGADSPQSFPVRKDPQTGRSGLVGFPSGGKPHRFQLRYDPAANNGAGVITASIDGEVSVCHLDAGHKSDEAAFNRFGILNVMKSADNGTEFYLDDLVLNGERFAFDADPNWDGHGNRTTFTTHNVRPRFDFGFSATHFAGGKGAGEMGGLFFRGDCRYPQRLAYYADRVGSLALDRPIRAAGKVAFRRGVSDSTTLLGFFHRASATRVNPSQSQGLPEGVLGVHIEGPSSEGFCFYPVARFPGHDGMVAPDLRTLRIHPDGASHDWTLEYDPAGPNGHGRVTATLDGRAIHLELKEGDKSSGVTFDRCGVTFDRFGVVTPWIDGNGQVVYFDDVTYSVSQ